MPAPSGNALIGQSGGPTVVINQSLVGVIEACLAAPQIKSVYGALHGIQGILDENLINLGLEDPAELERVAATPCAALRSVRRRPTEEDCERMLRVFQAHDIRYFFYIGGNDTAETADILGRVAAAANYEVQLFHVPKTIDNDLMVTDHCPGYPSAAKFVAQALMGDDCDNTSLGGVKIDVIMGRHAGWLTAAAGLGRRDEADGPHLIYVPEVAFDMQRFLERVATVMDEHGRCVAAVSEGIHDADGELIASSKDKDSHGNVQLSGTGALGDLLAGRVKEHLGKGARVRADTFGYLQRSYFGVVSAQDALEAREVGREAVRVATSGKRNSGSLVIERGELDGRYAPQYAVAKLAQVAGKTQVMPAEFLLGDDNVSSAFKDWAMPLVGELPVRGRLMDLPVPKRL
ncbi:MAG: 6-phosphofructokinase [Planctomycetota bacterium]|jgi:6-phosphofructokinase